MTPADLLRCVTQPAPAASPIMLAASRSDMAAMFAVAGFHKGAEIGVWEGGFAEQLCAPHQALQLICVDPWNSQPDYREGKNSPERMEQAYRTARKRLQTFNCTFLRMTSLEASAHVADGSLDFVYVDANHLFEHVLRDLQLWVPKVRAGGVVSGHDYGAAKKTKSYIQVKPAVDQFTRERAIDPWFVLADDKSSSFLWAVR